MVHEGNETDENLIPPRIYTEEYSINFAQTNKRNLVTFEPKPKELGGRETVQDTIQQRDMDSYARKTWFLFLYWWQS